MYYLQMEPTTKAAKPALLLETFRSKTSWQLETFHIERFIGSGTYTSVFKLQGCELVLRVSELKDNDLDGHRLLVRGETIVVLIYNLYGTVLRPLALKTLDAPFVVSYEQLPDEVKDRYYEEDDTSYWLSIHQYVGSKSFRQSYAKDDDEFASTAACLIYYLAFTQQELGLVHKDIHAGNIMWKDLKEPTTITINSNSLHFRRVTRVPMLIDFDMAVTAITRADHRKWLYSMAPERGFAALIDSTIDPLESSDWWNLGVALMGQYLRDHQWWWNPNNEYTDNAVEVIDNFLGNEYLENHDGIIDYMTSCMHIFAIVNELLGNGLTPPRNLYPPQLSMQYDAFFGAKAIRIITKAKKRFRHTEAIETMPQKLKDLFQLLLSWNPELRWFYGKPRYYLSTEFFQQYKIDMAPPPGGIVLDAPFTDTSGYEHLQPYAQYLRDKVKH